MFIRMLMHGNVLSQWSDKTCAPHLIPRDGQHVWTQQELKERLFQEIICYLDKGKVSVNLCAACYSLFAQCI